MYSHSFKLVLYTNSPRHSRLSILLTNSPPHHSLHQFSSPILPTPFSPPILPRTISSTNSPHQFSPDPFPPPILLHQFSPPILPTPFPISPIPFPCLFRRLYSSPSSISSSAFAARRSFISSSIPSPVRIRRSNSSRPITYFFSTLGAGHNFPTSVQNFLCT